MIYNIDFDIAGAIFLIILYVYLTIQYSTNEKSMKNFRLLVLNMLITDILDILTAVSISYASYVPNWINYVLNIVYFISVMTIVYFTLAYVYALLRSKIDYKKLINAINCSFVMIFILMTLSTPFTKLVFYFDENHIYRHGPFYVFLFIIPGYFIIVSAVITIKNRKKIKPIQFYSMMFFAVFSECGAILQLLLFKNILLSYFAASIAAFIVMFSLDTPDYEKLIQTLDELEKAKDESEKAKVEALMASKSKSEFLANMSHEIRTPMNGIMGLSSVALKENKDDKIKGHLKNINASGAALLAIINDILDISKIESGKMDIVCAKYRMSEVIDSIATILKMKANDKGLELTFDCDSTMPDLLYGDEVRVRQIMTNLINNAIKYTREGSVHVKLKYEWKDTNHIKLVIKVKDTGIGIKKEDFNRLFKSFERLNLEKNRTIEGTGLGLRITKELATLMNGDVDVKSEYGVGSVFTVSIVQEVLEDDSDDKNQKSDNLISDDSEKSFEGKNILVVDDVEMNIVVMSALLNDTKANVDTALSGKESLELMKAKKYDLIFMDHMMPEMDGIEVLNRMRIGGDNINKYTPIIMLTANAIVGAEEEYINCGFSDYISKPIDPGMLYSKLDRYLTKS